MSDHTKDHVTKCLSRCLEAEAKCRRSPCGRRSCGAQKTPEWDQYAIDSKEWHAAEMELWAATDFEYAEDGFCNLVWEWRYWKVMARKCCWSQRHGSTEWAGETMAKKGAAWAALVEACGLSEGFKSSCDYIEEWFPNLKKP